MKSSLTSVLSSSYGSKGRGDGKLDISDTGGLLSNDAGNWVINLFSPNVRYSRSSTVPSQSPASISLLDLRTPHVP